MTVLEDMLSINPGVIGRGEVISMDDANDRALARRGPTIKTRSRLLFAGCWMQSEMEVVVQGRCGKIKSLCVFEVEGCGAQGTFNMCCGML